MDDDHYDDSKNALRSDRITRSSTRGSITAENDNTNSDDNSIRQTQTLLETHDSAVKRRHTFPVLKVELPKIGLTSKTSELNIKKKSEETIDSNTEPEVKQSQPSVPTINEIKPIITPIEPKVALTDESRDESESDDKKTCERPRRGRRAKTRKLSESTLQLSRYETGCASAPLPITSIALIPALIPPVPLIATPKEYV